MQGLTATQAQSRLRETPAAPPNLDTDWTVWEAPRNGDFVSYMDKSANPPAQRPNTYRNTHFLIGDSKVS